MTVAEKLRLLAEFAETGEEFELCGAKYNFIDDILYRVEFENTGETKFSKLLINELVKNSIARLPFKPNKGEQYYLVSSDTGKGYFLAINHDGKLDRLILSRETVYRTEAEAQEEVRRRGWTVD